MKPALYVVLVTASDKKEADKISLTLLREKLAACVNIVPQIQSNYWWQGRIETASETLLIVKTKKNLLPQLIRKIKAIHSYDVPEVIALPVADGNRDYLGWVKNSVR